MTSPKSTINSLIPSIIVVDVKFELNAWVGSTLAFKTSISVSNSNIAPDTVAAVVPIAPAVIVPSSASCSLIASARVVAVVVNACVGSTKSWIFRNSLAKTGTAVPATDAPSIAPPLIEVTVTVASFVESTPPKFEPLMSIVSLTAYPVPAVVIATL